jgi:hypothetical protein
LNLSSDRLLDHDDNDDDDDDDDVSSHLLWGPPSNFNIFVARPNFKFGLSACFVTTDSKQSDKGTALDCATMASCSKQARCRSVDDSEV